MFEILPAAAGAAAAAGHALIRAARFLADGARITAGRGGIGGHAIV